MKRNIVQQGPTTLMVSLPIKWVRKYGLKKGEQVNVEERGRELTISTEEETERTKTEIDLLNEDYTYIWRMISTAYVSGYDEIKINFDKLEILKIVQKIVVEYFVGFEIVEQKKDYCIVKNVSGNRVDEFDAILKRIFLTLIQTSEIFRDYLGKGEDPSLILDLEKINNRQTYLLKRLLIREGFKIPEKTNFVFTLNFLLEQILNEYKFAVWYINDEKNVKITKKIVEHYDKLHKEIKDVYQLYYNYDNELIEEILVNGLKTNAETGENLVLFKDDARLAHSIVNITEKIRYIANQIVGINN